MIRVKRLVVFCFFLVTLAGPAPTSAYAQPPVPPEPQGEFTPIDQLPPGDRLPVGPAAATLLVAAYSFVLLAFFVYMASLARRLAGVQREVERLERDMKRNGRA